MGKVTRGGYIFLWWKGDHEPRHIHVRTMAGKELGRVDLATLRSLEGWTPSRKLIELIKEIKAERSL